MKRLLFICSGNMYRSAGAEYILRKKLAEAGIDDWIVDSAGTLQLNRTRRPEDFGRILAEKGYEFGETDGLGLIKGSVKLMHPEGNLPVPHIGWNALEKNEPCRLLDRCADGEYVYFVHSFAAECDSKNVAAYCDYGMKVPALVFEGNVYGAQFHPEKSGEVGLDILRCFAAL